MATSDTAEAEMDETPLCDYCRLPCSEGTVRAEHGGVEYEFCSTACRDALAGSDRVFTEYHGFRKFRPGVEALEAGLPQGVPRNSFVLVAGHAGTREEAFRAELVWRTLQRGAPAVIVSFLDTPASIVQQFATMSWNVIPYLESGQLHILDCFSNRLDAPDRMYSRMDEWNQHLHDVAADATTQVPDPSNVESIMNRLDSCLGTVGANDEGIVVIDSLTEVGSLVQPVRAYAFIRDLRAEVAKSRYVPVFATATSTGEGGDFPNDIDYLADGIVEVRLTGDIVPGALLKQVRVRKMAGVRSIREWQTYEFTSDEGLVTFDPAEQFAEAESGAAGSAKAEPAEATEQEAADPEATPPADPPGEEPPEE